LPKELAQGFIPGAPLEITLKRSKQLDEIFLTVSAVCGSDVRVRETIGLVALPTGFPRLQRSAAGNWAPSALVVRGKFFSRRFQ